MTESPLQALMVDDTMLQDQILADLLTDRVQLTIEDTGPGIDADVLANVFDPFFTTKEAGTGLGLSIVRKIVDQHGGEVRIDSAAGQGTRVHVMIPIGR